MNIMFVCFAMDLRAVQGVFSALILQQTPTGMNRSSYGFFSVQGPSIGQDVAPVTTFDKAEDPNTNFTTHSSRFVVVYILI